MIESIQIVLTALMLAFVFRAFFVEAFIIPTGSMAESLLGEHGVLVCPICGWEFAYGPETGAGRPGGFRAPSTTQCPNCHALTDLDPDEVAPRAGDRILVHKWPYVLGGPFGPKRWDVIVFRDPADPSQNYIKRLVALPNETIEIIDGDVFIRADDAADFHIARKTPAAQSMLWFVVFDQNYLPTDAHRAQRPPAWVTERPTDNRSNGWSGLATRIVRYQAADSTSRAIVFDPSGSRYYLQDVYGYDHGTGGNLVGDVRMVAEVTLNAGHGSLRWELIRDGRLFALHVRHDGQITLSTAAPGPDGDEITLATARVGSICDGYPRVFEFGHLDYRVYFSIDGREIAATTDEQYAPQLTVLRAMQRTMPVKLRMIAQDLSLEIRDLRLDRDVHYAYSRLSTLRAFANHPFRLGEQEYFVLGDNSPNSADSREWVRVGPQLQQAVERGAYQIGTVRANQIVGKAFFVYLPGLMPFDGSGGWRVPDLGRVRFVR